MNKPVSKNPPLHSIRHGAVRASIWRQDTGKGPLYNVTFGRIYKADGSWKTSASFGRSNLLALSLMATQAYEWIEYHANTLKH